MGAWKRCQKCGSKVEVLSIIASRGRKGKTDEGREAWGCTNPKCRHLEVVSKQDESVATKKE